MKELSELEAFCQERGLWLTYCTYQGKWKCYVNPGTIMHEAKWYTDRDEAIRAAKEAAGYKDPMPKELISLQSMRDTIMEVKKAADDVVESVVSVLSPKGEMEEFVNEIEEQSVGMRSVECIITAPVKKRGRPKGSRNKPKEPINE